jgi:sulfate/thiosulfate transport system substrate-binding protein
MKSKISLFLAVILAAGGFFPAAVNAQQNKAELLNVSYDPTRELYEDYNRAFARHWKEKTGQDLSVNQSHGGSGKQARAVIEGLEADVVTLALAYDVDALYQRARLIPKDWQTLLPQNSAPYTSTIVFVVRKGNPKGIKDWDDLAREGVSVITPNPKTSGGARWNYLAAWGYASKKFGGDETQVKDFMRRLFGNVPVLDSGARGATTTFLERGIGDVLISWENEAFLAIHKIGAGQYEMVAPSVSILAEPPVAVVEKVAKRHGVYETAKAYLEYLYSEEGQEIAAKHYYRPRLESVKQKYAGQFADLPLLSIDQDFGGWTAAQEKHFNDDGTFDEIYES